MNESGREGRDSFPMRVLVFVVVVLAAAFLGGALIAFGPWLSRRFRRTEYFREETLEALWTRFALGAIAGGLSGAVLYWRTARKIRRR